MDKYIDILFKHLFDIVDQILRRTYSDDHHETKRLLLNSPQGFLLKNMVVYAMLDKYPRIAAARGNRPTQHMITLTFASAESAAQAVIILDAIAEFTKEEFSITFTPEREQGGSRKIFCNF